VPLLDDPGKPLTKPRTAEQIGGLAPLVFERLGVGRKIDDFDFHIASVPTAFHGQKRCFTDADAFELFGQRGHLPDVFAIYGDNDVPDGACRGVHTLDTGLFDRTGVTLTTTIPSSPNLAAAFSFAA
jgi:hypothetical protein